MQPREDFRPLYWTMLALGLVAVLILALGVVTLLHFAPPGQNSGYRVHIDGVYPIDAHSGQVDGPPAASFRRDQPFAAQVRWQELPPDMVVGASWYDSLDVEDGRIGPLKAGVLAGLEALVPVNTPPDFHANLPGSYTLYVVRYADGRPVERLAAGTVHVRHEP